MKTRKIFPRAALAKVLKQAKPRRLVFTNGCFDLLHVGHVRLLKKARSLGDALVVAINSDLSLRALKGRGRPLVPQTQRAEVLAALASVDYVTVFDEDTPLETIRLLKPKVLMKGGDYELSEIVGKNQVKKVVRFPLVKSVSTTGLIRKIVKTYAR